MEGRCPPATRRYYVGIAMINHNIAALNALNALSITDARLSKSIERLASGLRINRAADDAAGLTISERLRGQIRGLSRAAANAQDGISLIQTAEGAMNEVSAILQRMRELAVQAANGVLTSNDRQEIQKEINQLTDEVNRIGQTTEFNTKTLLDGTIGALISSDDPTATQGIVVGDVGKGGNFILQKALVVAPTLQVQKSSPFNTIAGEDRVGIVNGEYTFLPNVAQQDNATSTIGLTDMVVQPSANGSVAMSLGQMQVTVDSQVGISNGTTLVSTIGSREITAGVDYISITGRNASLATFTATFTITAASDWQSIANFLSTALGPTAGDVQVAVDATSVSTGILTLSALAGNSFVLSSFDFVDADGSGSELSAQIGAANLGVTVAAGSIDTNTLVQEISVSVDAGGSTWSGAINTSNQTTIGNANTGTVDVRFTTGVLGAVGNTDTLSIAKSGGVNELQLNGVVTQVSTPEDNYTFRVTALSNRTYSVENLTTGSVAANTGSIAVTGTETGLGLDSLRGIELTFDGIFQTGETAVFHSSTNNVLVAQNDTTLSSISRFRDFGVFDGRDSLKLELNYGANGASASIIVNATDTVETFEAKVSLAIANPNSTSDLNLEGAIRGGNAPDLVHYNLTGPAQGTFSIMTPDPSGELVFAGDEKLLNALGLVDIESRSAPVYSVTAINIHTGESVGSIRTNTNKIQGLIAGVDVVFDTTVGFKLDADPGSGTYGNNFTNDRTDLEGATWAADDPNKTGVLPFIKAYERPTVSIITTAETEFLHVAPTEMTLQIGANQGQTLGFNIEQMDAVALGIDNVLVVNPELAQAAITKVDDAINAVASQRAKLGAIQNRLESTIRNLNVTMENLTAAESRIRDLDIAQQTIDFTRDQILLQAGTAVLAQANQLPNIVLSLLR